MTVSFFPPPNRVLFLVLLLLGGAACGDVVDPGEDVTGTYTLAEVNDTAPPAVVFSQDVDSTHVEVTVTEGMLVLEEETYRIEVELDVTWDGQPFPTDPWSDAGRYTVEGNVILFTSNTGETSGSGRWSDGEIIVSDTHPEYGSIRLLFRK